MADTKAQHTPMTLWIQSVVVRLEALESIIRKNLAVPDEEIRRALEAVALKYPLPENPDNAGALAEFLEGLTTKQTTPVS